MSEAQRIGFVVNPVAGIGGSVALAGSDGAQIQAEARTRGGVARAPARAERFVKALRARMPGVDIFAAPGALGAAYAPGARELDLAVGTESTAEDTIAAVVTLVREGVDLLIFVGGDGTARDVLRGLDILGDEATGQVCLGVPAGVKMHSGVFAVTPEDAAVQAAEVLSSREPRTQLRDVADLDEEARRQGVIATNIFGGMLVPVHERLQRGKRSTMGVGTRVDAAGIARALRRDGHDTLVFGPGSTVTAVASEFGLQGSLLGFDVLTPKGDEHLNLTGAQLEALLEGREFSLVLSPIGGQGFLIGRGNHQLTERVLTITDPSQLFIVADLVKLGELAGKLRVDTPTIELNERFRGYRRVLLGEYDTAIVQVV